MSRILIAFCVGIVATLAWQSYGDAARQTIADSYPQLAWLAPQAAVAQAAPDTIARDDPPDHQELKAISLDLAAVREKVDQLAASQQQIAREFTAKLQEIEREILDKVSINQQPQATVPARRPASPPPQAVPAR